MKKINEALSLVELLEFTVFSAVSGTSDPEGPSRNLPLEGLGLSLSQIRDLLSDFLAESQNNISLPRQNSNNKSSSSTETDYEYSSANSQSGKHIGQLRRGLSSRIRPVPAEVRGRVRELVDMLEEEEAGGIQQFEESIG
ncbi:MAG TPA: hypothetical protein PKA63_02905 [Oligoflexia bacterium]|nr:hypothetical protein [Oligoflexia bacterium]HMP47603.1 hypothetical protein [Oligoflexia bacterium]